MKTEIIFKANDRANAGQTMRIEMREDISQKEICEFILNNRKNKQWKFCDVVFINEEVGNGELR